MEGQSVDRESLAETIWVLVFHLRFTEKFRVKQRNPKDGDLVCEISSGFRGRDIKNVQRIGTFVEKKWEEFQVGDEKDNIARDEFTYIVDLDGNTQRWSNCEFFVIPKDLGFSFS